VSVVETKESVDGGQVGPTKRTSSIIAGLDERVPAGAGFAEGAHCHYVVAHLAGC
jgi:hypothetical protein